MFTKNNYILQKGDNYGDAYKKVNLSELGSEDQVMTVQLPDCNVSFPTEVDIIETSHTGRDGMQVFQLNLVNTQGQAYTVELPSTNMKAFCKFSKFKAVENIINWYQNFALVDWLGFPCKIKSVTESWYTGPLYKVQVKDSNNVIVSGIVFSSLSDEESDDLN